MKNTEVRCYPDQLLSSSRRLICSIWIGSLLLGCTPQLVVKNQPRIATVLSDTSVAIDRDHKYLCGSIIRLIDGAKSVSTEDNSIWHWRVIDIKPGDEMCLFSVACFTEKRVTKTTFKGAETNVLNVEYGIDGKVFLRDSVSTVVQATKAWMSIDRDIEYGLYYVNGQRMFFAAFQQHKAEVDHITEAIYFRSFVIAIEAALTGQEGTK